MRTECRQLSRQVIEQLPDAGAQGVIHRTSSTHTCGGREDVDPRSVVEGRSRGVLGTTAL